ncbi:MAG: hypothetical protein IH867_11770 [Chloroflexi bacterium]|nr:hypothetical protein [Chloroflexota bacterium]
MWHRPLFSVCLVVIALAGLSACGSESSGAGVASDQNAGSAPADAPGTSMIIDDGEIYTIDDFVAAGYKKVTQFDLETLPGATDAWFGFANQKDFEIRIYPTHQIALDEGVEPAEIAIGKGAVPWQKAPPVRFFSYVVVGNVVMLCELEVASCEALIAQLE